jgi:hypothetical protein
MGLWASVTASVYPGALRDTIQAVALTTDASGAAEVVPDGTLAMTDCYPSLDEELSICAHTECDTTFYWKGGDGAGTEWDIEWTTSTSPDGDHYSIAATLVHELGHALGLGHPAVTLFPTSTMTDTTAKGSYIVLPSSDDQAMILWIYG